MNKFEQSCAKFKKKYGYNTPKQIKVLDEIKRQRRQKPYRYNSYNSYDMQQDSDFRSAFDWGSQ